MRKSEEGAHRGFGAGDGIDLWFSGVVPCF